MMRYDVLTHERTQVYDASTQYGNKYIWQMHSSYDDRVHSATLRDSEVRLRRASRVD